jgi:hypothetical protein
MMGATLYYKFDIFKLTNEFSLLVGLRVARRVRPVLSPTLPGWSHPVGASHLVLVWTD